MQQVERLAGRLVAAALLAVGAFSSAGSPRADEVTVVAWGGATQDVLRSVYFKPFEKHSGTKVLEDSWNGGIGVLRAKVEANAVNWDVVEVESEELVLGCEEGLFVPLDWGLLGGRDAFIGAGANECGVGALVWSTVLAYDKDRLPDGPKSWVDFWDLERYPGKRGLRKGPKFSLEFALYADGVAPEDIYATLRTPAGVDRAFAKLSEIKDQILWWETGAQPQQLLASGEVVMTSAYNGRITSANWSEGKNFGIAWPGSLYAVDSWVILQGSPNPDAAMKLIAFMSDAVRQAEFPNHIAYGVPNKQAARMIKPEILTQIPTGPENLSVQIEVDTEFWVENIEALNERFNAWIAN